MFYPKSEISDEFAKKLGLFEINVNIINITDLNIDKSNQVLVDAWNIVKEHFVGMNNCWATIGYVRLTKLSLWKRILDFW